MEVEIISAIVKKLTMGQNKVEKTLLNLPQIIPATVTLQVPIVTKVLQAAVSKFLWTREIKIVNSKST